MREVGVLLVISFVIDLTNVSVARTVLVAVFSRTEKAFMCLANGSQRPMQ